MVCFIAPAGAGGSNRSALLVEKAGYCIVLRLILAETTLIICTVLLGRAMVSLIHYTGD
jgi:hypothetical protein